MQHPKNSFKILRQFIREEIGRNFHTIIDAPYTFADFQDYDIQINGDTAGGFFLTVFYKQEKIFPTQRFGSNEEALHTSRMIIDKDRVSRMNHAKKENKKNIQKS